MKNIRLIIAWGLALGYLSIPEAIVAAEQEFQVSVPAGRYLYLGPRGKSAPKAFTIFPGGTVVWKEPADRDKEFESYEYPLIKWRKRPLESRERDFAALTTNYESGIMKFNVIVDKSRSTFTEMVSPARKTSPDVTGLAIRFLDQDGFEIPRGAFDVEPRDFHQISGTSQWKATGAVPWSEDVYKNASQVVFR